LDGNNWSPRDPKICWSAPRAAANKGIFITTSDFSREALDYVARIGSKIVLIDGPTLAQLMIDFGIGVTAEKTYEN